MKNSRKSFSLAVALIAIGALTEVGHTALILTITGTPGSNMINVVASGTGVTVVNSTAAASSSAGRAPVAGEWTASYDNDLGDFLDDSMDIGLNDDLGISAPITYFKNSVSFGTVALIDFDGGAGGGSDDVELDPFDTISYPSLISGDVFSWSGGGVVMLEDGETFDSFFTEGTYSNAVDGGEYTVIISSAIPEPSSTLLLGLVSLSLAFRRFRR